MFRFESQFRFLGIVRSWLNFVVFCGFFKGRESCSLEIGVLSLVMNFVFPGF